MNHSQRWMRKPATSFDELERVWRETGQTIIFVTHNVREAVRLGDRVLVLSYRPGRIKTEFFISLPRPRHRRFRGRLHVKRVLGHLREEIDKSVRAEFHHEQFSRKIARQVVFYTAVLALWQSLALLKLWPPYVFQLRQASSRLFESVFQITRFGSASASA
jgi:energy-coupling factor transporter ATP-binding protein EcfA2